MSAILSYNVDTIPIGISMETIIAAYETKKIVFYSTAQWNQREVDPRPQIFNVEDDETEIRVVDTEEMLPADAQELINVIQNQRT